MKQFASLAVVLALIAGHACAEVNLVREYRLKPPRDRRILFAMAMSPEQDVLTLIASKDGKWRLSRVRGWLSQFPQEETLTIPGLAEIRPQAWSEPWETQLLVTADGKYAVCVASGWQVQPRGTKEDLVSAVSLLEFKVVASIHASEVAELGGDYRLYDFERKGYVVVRAVTALPRGPGDDRTLWGYLDRIALLSPFLTVRDHCQYSEWQRSGSPVRLENESNCAALLQSAEAASLDGFRQNLLKNNEVARTDQRMRPPGCTDFGYASHISRDGRLRRDMCTDVHWSLWGHNPVISNVAEIIFSVKTGEKLGSVKEPNYPVQSQFARMEGRDYLLVMEGGTLLRVYQITN